MKRTILLASLLTGGAITAMSQEPLIYPEEGRTLLECVTNDDKSILTISVNPAINIVIRMH